MLHRGLHKGTHRQHGIFLHFFYTLLPTTTHRNQFRLDMHFIPGSWCTLLLRRTFWRCLNLLPSFPPLGRNNSQRHGRNTGRLRRKPPTHTHTHTHTHNYSICLSKPPLAPLSVFKNLKLLILQKRSFKSGWGETIKSTLNKKAHPLPVYHPCVSH